MTKKRLSGLDELMIVNPRIPFTEKDSVFSQIYLSEDGTLYSMEGLQSRNSPTELAEFYLGEDGTLYQRERPEPSHTTCNQGLGHMESHYGQYFLGEDGTLYEMVAL
jgi:hypothetical protein